MDGRLNDILYKGSGVTIYLGKTPKDDGLMKNEGVRSEDCEYAVRVCGLSDIVDNFVVNN